MNTPVREGETIGGVPYHAESTLSSAQVLKQEANIADTGGVHRSWLTRAPWWLARAGPCLPTLPDRQRALASTTGRRRPTPPPASPGLPHSTQPSDPQHQRYPKRPARRNRGMRQGQRQRAPMSPPSLRHPPTALTVGSLARSRPPPLPPPFFHGRQTTRYHTRLILMHAHWHTGISRRPGSGVSYKKTSFMKIAPATNIASAFRRSLKIGGSPR